MGPLFFQPRVPPPLSPLMRNGGFLGRGRRRTGGGNPLHPRGGEETPLLPSWHKQKMLRETLSSGHDKWRLWEGRRRKKGLLACTLQARQTGKRTGGKGALGKP